MISKTKEEYINIILDIPSVFYKIIESISYKQSKTINNFVTQALYEKVEDILI